MQQRRIDSLTRLQALAALKREAELARLATVAQSRNRLQAAVDALKSAEAPLDPADGQSAALTASLIAARLAHRRWIESQQRRLNQQLALVTADYLRQKPAAARAFGRAAVLDQLTQEARDAQRLAKHKAR